LYQRRKTEIAGVELEVNSLREEQQQLKEENERLSWLITEAHMAIALYEARNQTMFVATSYGRRRE